MKHLYSSVLVFALCVSCYASSESAFRDISMEEVESAFNRPIQAHPRLFMTNKQMTEIQTKLESQRLDRKSVV